MAINMAFREGLSKRRLWVIFFLWLAASGCNRESAQLSALREDNERLKKALEEARSGTPASQETDSGSPAQADLDLSIAELWSQRFQEIQYRAKQRLDKKLIRVTGFVENVSDRSVTIFGTGTRFGSVSLVAQLEESYIRQIETGLVSLKKGATVTVQGRFLFDKMWLENAVFVDRGTGKRLVSEDLATAADSESQAPPKTPAEDTTGNEK
jgi:acylphosphatase